MSWACVKACLLYQPETQAPLINTPARGPSPVLLQHNPDLAHLAADPLELWEHFLLLGQFQGRLHRCDGWPGMGRAANADGLGVGSDCMEALPVVG